MLQYTTKARTYGLVKIVIIILLSVIFIGFFNKMNQAKSYYDAPSSVNILSRTKSVIPGDILDSDGKVIVTTDLNGDRVYKGDRETNIAYSNLIGLQFNEKYSTLYSVEGSAAKYTYGFNDEFNKFSFRGTLFDTLSGKRRGGAVKLTVDTELQKKACSLSKEKSSRGGSVMIMNYETGDILVEASGPGFDPNNKESIDVDDKGRYISTLENNYMLTNKNLEYLRPAGSVQKAVISAIALESNQNLMNFTNDCKAVPANDKKSLKCHKNHAHGNISMRTALTESCNKYFANLAADKLGKDLLCKEIQKYGYDKELMLSQMHVRDGTFSGGKEKKMTGDELKMSAIGQGLSQTTALNIGMIMGAFANKGAMVEPQSFLEAGYKDNELGVTFEPKVMSRVCSENTANTMINMMKDVVNSGTGKRAKVPGYEIFGKTGTAEIFKGSDEMNSDSGNTDNISDVGSGKSSNFAWFAGGITGEKGPRLVIVVCLDKVSSTGGESAADVAGKMLAEAVKKY